jgi:hypothetical protein
MAEAVGGQTRRDRDARKRVSRAVAYLEQDEAEVAVLDGMGLTSADIAEVIALADSRDRVRPALRDEVARLYATRRAVEESAGLAVPLVVVKPQATRLWKLVLAGGAALLAVLGGVIVAAIARGGGPTW